MNRSIEELKIRAKKLQKSFASGDKNAIKHLKRIHTTHQEVKRRTCLNSIAMDLGFSDWSQAKTVLSGEDVDGVNRGTLWYSQKCMPFLNLWFATYEEARAVLKDNPDFYLVPYKKQFIVVDHNYLKAINLWEGCQTEWQAIDRDAVNGYGAPEWHHLVWARIVDLRKKTLST
ncbi:MAG: hypothetical protein OQJ97_10830 [Rhodospirillales bacterium]|nr:hypothetical protein [Rhodospirillales bacterium]